MARKGRQGRQDPAGEAPQGGHPNDGIVFIALVLLAWTHRLFFLWSNRDRAWPLSIFYEGDGETFFRHARALLEGRVYDGGIPFHPPGFPAFLALLHSLLGAGPGAEAMPHLAVKVSLALVSSLGIGVLYLLVRPYLGRPTALLAALLCVYNFGLYVLAVATVAEGLYLTLLLVALLLWSRWLEHPLRAPTTPRSDGVSRIVAPVSLGLVLGFMALTRAEGIVWLVLLAGLGVVAALGRGAGKRWRALTPWLLVIAAWCVVVAPWTLHNRSALGQFNARYGSSLVEPLPTFVPITIYGPLNFALANNDDADGSFSADLLMSGKGSARLDFRDPEVLRLVVHGYRIGGAWIAEHPLDFARLVARRWGLSSQVFRLGWTQWNWPGGLRGERRPVDIFVPSGGAVGYVMPVLVVIGFVICWRAGGAARRWALVVTMATAVWPLTTGVFFGYVRLALLCVPLWYSLAAAAVVVGGARVWQHPVARRLATGRFGVLPWLALLISAGLLLEGWGATADRNYRASAASTIDGHHLNRDDTIHLEPIP